MYKKLRTIKKSTSTEITKEKKKESETEQNTQIKRKRERVDMVFAIFATACHDNTFKIIVNRNKHSKVIISFASLLSVATVF